MRLFIGIRLKEEVRESVFNNIRKLSGASVSGNFTAPQNLLISLVMLGETDTSRTSEIKEIMDRINETPFDLHFGGLGRFKRPGGGDTYFEGVDKHPTLLGIQRQLSTSFKSNDFKVEAGEFKPHVVLGREVILKPETDIAKLSAEIPVVSMECDRISLFKSELFGGKQTYSEMYGHDIFTD